MFFVIFCHLHIFAHRDPEFWSRITEFLRLRNVMAICRKCIMCFIYECYVCTLYCVHITSVLVLQALKVFLKVAMTVVTLALTMEPRVVRVGGY